MPVRADVRVLVHPQDFDWCLTPMKTIDVKQRTRFDWYQWRLQSYRWCRVRILLPWLSLFICASMRASANVCVWWCLCACVFVPTRFRLMLEADGDCRASDEYIFFLFSSLVSYVRVCVFDVFAHARTVRITRLLRALRPLAGGYRMLWWDETMRAQTEFREQSC